MYIKENANSIDEHLAFVKKHIQYISLFKSAIANI